MKEKTKIITGFLIVIALLVVIVIRTVPVTITKEIKQECPIEKSFTDNVYVLSDGVVEHLPFCGLLYSTNDETFTDSHGNIVHFCYDWSGWNGFTGVSVINLSERK